MIIKIKKHPLIFSSSMVAMRTTETRNVKKNPLPYSQVNCQSHAPIDSSDATQVSSAVNLFESQFRHSTKRSSTRKMNRKYSQYHYIQLGRSYRCHPASTQATEACVPGKSIYCVIIKVKKHLFIFFSKVTWENLA